MKKFLALLWIVIIAGTIFIAVHFFKPGSETPEAIETAKNPEENLQEEETVTDSLNYSEYLNKGDEKFAQGYYAQAIENYTRAANLNPQSIEPLIRLGQSHTQNNEYEKARSAFSKAMELKPDDQAIKFALAKAHLNAREIDQAKNIIWSLDGNNHEVKYYKGIILILHKKFEEAKNIFTEIATADPPPDSKLETKLRNFLQAYTTFSYYSEAEEIFLELLLAQALVSTDEFAAAIPVSFDIINQKNNYRDAWIVLGYAYLNTGKIPDAIDALTQAKDLSPKKPETLFFLGLAYFANNEIDEAIYYLEEADKAGFQPKDELNLKLGDLYSIKENFPQASRRYETIIARNPKNIEVYVKAVWLNIDKLNKPQKALELALESLKFHPEKEMSHNLAGWAYTAVGNFEKAKEYLRAALEMNPNLAAANLNFGWLYEKQGLTKLAREYYQRAYTLARGNSIGNRAAIRFNNLR